MPEVIRELEAGPGVADDMADAIERKSLSEVEYQGVRTKTEGLAEDTLRAYVTSLLLLPHCNSED